MTQEVRDIGWAVEQLKAGNKVRRAGWNGKGMFLVFVPGGATFLKPNTPYFEALGGFKSPVSERSQQINSHVDMYNAQGEFQPGWLCSQADLLATDWELA